MSAETKKRKRDRRGCATWWAEPADFQAIREQHPDWGIAEIVQWFKQKSGLFVRPEDLRAFGVQISINQHKKTKVGDGHNKGLPTKTRVSGVITGYPVHQVVAASILMRCIGKPVVRWWDGSALHPIAPSLDALRRSRSRADDAPVWPFRPIRIPVSVAGLPAAHRRTVIGIIDATTRTRGPVEWLTPTQWRVRSAATRAELAAARAAGRAMVAALRRAARYRARRR